MALPDFNPSGVPRSASEILAGYYNDAAARLKKIVLTPPGRTHSSQAFNRARAASLIAQIDQQVIPGLLKNASGWVRGNVPPAYMAGKRQGEQQVKDWGLAPKDGGLSGDFSVIDHRALNVLAQDAMADLENAARSMGDGARRVLRKTADMGLSSKDLNDILARGVIEGKPADTIRELKTDLERVHNGQVVQIVNKNGGTMNFDSGYYAELVVRTRTREAVQEGRHQRLRENDVLHVSITGRVSENFCTAFLGQIYYIGSGQDPAGYPELPLGGPPFHPNCSKSTRAVVLELADPEQLAAGKPDDDAAKVAAASNPQKAYKDLQLRPAVTQRYGKISPIQGAKRQTVEGQPQ